ncbi:MAG: formylglycine-generating enzyme family protein [Planctomycetes bacterium]|nr:formylglycine-generating enzyme family protein [Planctomycetota bacterium]
MSRCRKIIWLSAVLALAGGWCLTAGGADSPATQPAPWSAIQPADLPASQPATQPAKEITLDLGNKVTMKLVLIPAGKFTIGSPKDEKNHCDDESPQHEVAITKAFYMGIYEITQEQYEQIVGKNPSKIKGAQNPVENVSWDDAVEFCQKLSKMAGKTIRLPTEAQWEWACRAGGQTRFCFGDDDDELDNYGWHSGNGEKTHHPVGKKKPNAYGLYDMHGNLWEWCTDWYAPYTAEKSVDPIGPDAGECHVLRSGCWLDCSPQICRSARRGWYVPDIRTSTVGFRVIVDLHFTPQMRAEVDRLIEQLDSDDFRTRDSAHKKLKEMCPAVLPILKEIQAGGKLSVEAAVRIKTIIEFHNRRTQPKDVQE